MASLILSRNFLSDVDADSIDSRLWSQYGTPTRSSEEDGVERFSWFRGETGFSLLYLRGEDEQWTQMKTYFGPPLTRAIAEQHESVGWLRDRLDLSRWEVISHNEDGAEAFDTHRLDSRSGFIRAWVRRDYREPQRLEAVVYDYVLTQWDIDCEGGRLRNQRFLFYRDRSVVESWTEPRPQWDSIIPDSLGERIAETICSYADA
jgi:hypothetical protein